MKKIILATLLLSTSLAVAQTIEQPSLVPTPTVDAITADELVEITNSINNEIIELGSKTQNTIDILQQQIQDLDLRTQDDMNKMFDSLMNEIDGLQIETEQDTSVFYSKILNTLTDLNKKVIELEQSLLILEESQDIAKINLLFEFDSVNAVGDWQKYINIISKFLISNPEWHLTIVGHADEKGSEKYNYNLGLQRAEFVKAQLVAQSVSEDRISIQSFGEKVPAALGNTEEIRQLNRRTNFALVKK